MHLRIAAHLPEAHPVARVFRRCASALPGLKNRIGKCSPGLPNRCVGSVEKTGSQLADEALAGFIKSHGRRLSAESADELW
jgi:hypothetical protein